MKIYITSDMEGISGICRSDQVMRDSSAYTEGRRYLCADVNAAIDGAIEGGATEIVVCDAHGGGFNFIMDEMDRRPQRYETTMPGGVRMPSLDESFDGVILVGYHAMAGTQDAFLDHTMSSASVYNYYINGIRSGEIGLEAAYAGHYGVPIIMASGDAAACAEAERVVPGLQTAVVKHALGRNSASCLPPEVARQRIREAAGHAVQRCRQIAPQRPQTPIEVILELYRSDMADGFAARRGTERIEARMVRAIVDTALNIWPW